MGTHKVLFTALFVPVLAMATLALSTAANAALVQFNDKVQFNANILSEIQFIDFDSNDLSAGTLGHDFFILDAFDNENAYFDTTDGAGPYLMTNPNYGLPTKYMAAPNTGDLQITFGEGVSAIGLDVGVLGDPNEFPVNNPPGATYSYVLQYMEASIVSVSSGTFNVGGGMFSFLGLVSDFGDLIQLDLKITSDPLNSSPNNAINGTGEAIDNIILGVAAPQSVVPVPAALPLFGTGIAFLGFMGWLRKRRAA